MKYAVAYLTRHGYVFLCGFETACCGERIIPYFSRLGSDAIPLPDDFAAILRDSLMSGVSPKGIKFVVVPYPVKEVDQ